MEIPFFSVIENIMNYFFKKEVPILGNEPRINDFHHLLCLLNLFSPYRHSFILPNNNTEISNIYLLLMMRNFQMILCIFQENNSLLINKE